jgi:hypothetical protein
MKRRTLAPIALATTLFQFGCATSQTQKNLVDGTETKKEGWFQMRAEKEHLEPHEQRREDASYLGRKR